MTRANINFVYQEKGHMPKTLYFYQNGDQYPRGLRDFYHVEDFLTSDWSPKAFKEWLAKNYHTQGRQITKFENGLSLDAHVELPEQAKPKRISHPCVYYDHYGNIADWSYVFDSTLEKAVKAYCWDKLVFSGDAKGFSKWLKRQE